MGWTRQQLQGRWRVQIKEVKTEATTAEEQWRRQKEVEMQAMAATREVAAAEGRGDEGHNSCRAAEVAGAEGDGVDGGDSSCSRL